MFNYSVIATGCLLLITNFQLNAGQLILSASLKNWKVYGKVGGKLSLSQSNKNTLQLATEKNINPARKESWDGALVWNRKAFAVVPGIKYIFRAEIRSDTSFKMSLLEYQDKYSAKIRSEKYELFSPKNTDWKTYIIEYTPSFDNISYVKPLFKISGWRKRLELRNASFIKKPGTGSISIKSKIFITSPGECISFTVKSSSLPVKFFLYGPDGTSGAGGDNGGSGAWSDHFKNSYKFESGNKKRGILKLHLPANAIEGTYRLVAVTSNDNNLAQLEFNVYSKKISDKIRSLTKQINLPLNTKIIFVGDSLTDLFRGRNYVSLIERALRWRFNNKVEVINAGVGGDNIKKIVARLNKDVVSRKPDIVFIFEGANDIKRRYSPQMGKVGKRYVERQEYVRTYQSVINTLKSRTKAKIIIATCAPVDQDIREEFHKTARIFGDQINFYGLPEDIANVVQTQKKIAHDNNILLIDINKRLNRYLKYSKQVQQQYPHVDDGVHLSEYGNREVAIYFLEYLAGL